MPHTPKHVPDEDFGQGSSTTTFQERLDEAKSEVVGAGTTVQDVVPASYINPDPITQVVPSQSVTSSPSIPTVLPSLPSISNVGSNSFTGTVSNIPGGFQPLPQNIGGKKKLYQLSQFHGGLNQKSSPRDIADIECQEATNITFSSIGAIKLLGDIKGTDNSITTHAIGTAGRNASGYGLFQFTAPAAIDGTEGQYIITLSADGDRIDAFDSTGTSLFIDYGGSSDNNSVAHVIYSAGNGVYANDANFDNASSNNPRKSNVYVNRNDIHGASSVSGWKEGKALIDSPTYNTTSDDANSVDLQTSHANSGGNGRMEVTIIDNGTAGLWNGDYIFYVSWLFDGGAETGLTSIGSGDTFANEQCEFNVSIKHVPHASNNTELGGNKRIEGSRIYFKKSGDTERFLLAEVSLIDGVKGALDSTFTPWDTPSTNIHDLASNILFTAPPEIYTYASLNGYYANEVYNKSFDSLSTDDTGPTAFDLRYKTAVVGSSGIVYIGNVKFDGRHMPDVMMYSMQGKPGVFPKYNKFDSPSSDGSPITALASYRDKILQFKQNGLYVINVSNPNQYYAEASFRDCGVFNPCQVFTTSFGVIFANKFGCYVYDGQKVMSLTSGKFDQDDWGLTEGTSQGGGSDTSPVPCVGYDPRSKNIIVLKSIGDNADSTGAWIYNMITQSWTEGLELITNADDDRHSNFIITSSGYLSILRDDSTSLFNYKEGNNAQKVIYQTKDLDFGIPTQTKKLFKVYITYKGNATNLVATWRYNGESTERGFTATNWADNSGTDDYEVATLVPDNVDESKGWKSMSLNITSGSNTVATDFEINDISILYRLRPIK